MMPEEQMVFLEYPRDYLHEVLEAMLVVANRPPYTFPTNTPEQFKIRRSIYFIEDCWWKYQEGLRLEDCPVCRGDCRYEVQWVQTPDDEANSAFRAWSEIERFAQSALNDEDELAAPYLGIEDLVAWLREQFELGNIDRDPEDHDAPMLIGIAESKPAQRNVLHDWKAFVWYTAGGFRDREFNVRACLPTREHAERWRADYLGPESSDEITSERVRDQGIFPRPPADR